MGHKKSFAFLPVALVVGISTAGCNAPSARSNAASNAATTSETHGLSKIAWAPWDETVFKRASTQKKLVLLDLKAVWCHWCHVMDEKTYADDRVASILNQSFLPTHVDQDSRPDLAARYEDYGWPATIIFDSNGRELAKKSGYIAPEQMIELLKKVVRDPSPMEDETLVPPANLTPSLTDSQRKKLEADVLTRYDQRQGSWDVNHKFMDAGFADLFLKRTLYGDKKAAKWLRQTLDQNLKLHDPVWGGVYQYSTGRVWNEPHFEKIMSIQADNLRVYAQASLVFQEPKYLEASKKTADYIQKFLTSSEGAFYTSQDADVIPGKHSEGFFKLSDPERRKQGIPAVDKNRYARENGWVIAALTVLYAASGERAYLERAERAAAWIEANRKLEGGGYRHAEQDGAGPYLGDTVAMGLANLKLYSVTGSRNYYDSAVTAAQFIERNFRDKKAGYAAAVSKGLPSHPMGEENLQLAHFANLLYRYSGDGNHKLMAEHALKFLTIPDVAESYYISASLLQLASEVEAPPVHIALVAPKKDVQAAKLWTEAMKFPLSYQRVDWWDRTEGNLPSNDVAYPELSHAAVFTCTESRCSLPAFEIADVQKRIKGLSK